MKKLFFLSAICFGLATTGNAQMTTSALKSEIKKDKEMGESGRSNKQIARKELRKLKGNEVSYNSRQAFAERYGNIKPINTERLNN